MSLFISGALLPSLLGVDTMVSDNRISLFPASIYTHLCSTSRHSAQYWPYPDPPWISQSFCLSWDYLSLICNARLFLSLAMCAFFITSMPWRVLEMRVVLWGIGQHHVMLSTGQACSAFSLSMARTSLRTSTMPWLWWPSPFRSSLRRRISQSLLEAVLAIQTSGRLAHSSNGEARDERWLAFASFPTNHPFAFMHYHTLPLVWHWQE